MSVEEQIHLAERLSFLLKAGVSLVDSLHMIYKGTTNKRTQKVLEHIIDDVSSGKTLSEGFARAKHIFTPAIIQIVYVGEISGSLGENLHFASLELKKHLALRRKLMGALLYPVFISISTVGLVSLLMLYIFPKILPIFKSMHVKLPPTTRLLLFLNDWLMHYWLAALAVIAIFIVCMRVYYKKSIALQYVFHACILKLPFIKKVSIAIILTQYTRTSGLLLKSGIPLPAVMEITKNSCRHLVFKKAFNELVSHLLQGAPISSALSEKRDLFPSIVPQMIAVGEVGGSLPDSFLYLAELYEAEVDTYTKSLSTFIEPVLMIVMGIVVGFIAISIISPIYDITQNIHA